MPTNGHMLGGSEVLLGKREGEALATATGPHCQGAVDLERTDLYVGGVGGGITGGPQGALCTELDSMWTSRRDHHHYRTANTCSSRCMLPARPLRRNSR